MSVASDQNVCDVHLHAEIEVLKQALVEKQNQLIAMETACLRESDRQVELEDSIIAWQDKYDRLYESHKRVQKVNQSLEDKLLKLVDRNSGERAQLTSDVATLSVRLAQANYNIAKLQREIERYKTDINLAIQLLQCKPDSFVPQKVSSLPMDIQTKVSSYMRLETNSHSDSEGSTSGVGIATSSSYKVLPASDSPPPICPFPPTAMVYSMRGLDAQNSECTNNNSNEQMISPSIMVKYLEDELKASEIKHCDTCKCSTKDLTVLADEAKTYSVGTQTTIIHGEGRNSLCLRCNSNLNSPSRTNSPYIMKLIKSNDSVISETKSSVSDLNDGDKLFTPAKKDDLMVNPILSHHRLCDRTTSSNNKQNLLTNNSNSSNNNTNNNSSNQQLCDTAKYIVENRKQLDGDLIDLRKYANNKSPINNITTTIDNDINSLSYNRNSLINDKLLNDTSRKSDSSNLLIDTGVVVSEGTITIPIMTATVMSDNNSIQGKGSDNNNGIGIGVDDIGKKLSLSSEQQSLLHHENGGGGGGGGASSGYSSAEKGNLQTTITGSTNSLWSKTSSSEGAKIFENFNRNLIRTIKAENPKYRGPRLCALRIQNGSNNILLDNVDSELTPVIYTRRQRFLDEELDDTKDIITSKISMVMSNHQTNIPSNSSRSASTLSTTTEQKILLTSSPELNCSNDDEINEDGNIIGINTIDSTLITTTADNSSNTSKITQEQHEKFCDSIHSKEDSKIVLGLNLDNSIKKQDNCIKIISNQMIGNQQQDIIINKNEEIACNNSNSNIQSILTIKSNNCFDQQYSGIKSLNCVINEMMNQQQQQHQSHSQNNFDLMTSCDNSANSKSCTQSSSISSSGADVDLQENAILRRQQLNRVAEWVQNNSQIDHITSSNHKSLNNNNCNNYIHNNNDSNSNISMHKNNSNNSNNNNNCDKNRDIDIMLPSAESFHDSSIEKLSLDSAYKMAKQIQNGIYSNSSNVIDNSISGNNLYTSKATLNPLYCHSQLSDENDKIHNNYHHLSDSIAQNNFLENRKYFFEGFAQNMSTIQHQQQQQQEQLNTTQKQQLQLHLPNDQIQLIKHKQYNGGGGGGGGGGEGTDSIEKNHKVDLIQMEYNVKQFLLKQNEWSIRNKLSNINSINSGGPQENSNSSHNNSVVNSNRCISNRFDQPAVKNQPRRTETNL